MEEAGVGDWWCCLEAKLLGNVVAAAAVQFRAFSSVPPLSSIYLPFSLSLLPSIRIAWQPLLLPFHGRLCYAFVYLAGGQSSLFLSTYCVLSTLRCLVLAYAYLCGVCGFLCLLCVAERVLRITYITQFTLARLSCDDFGDGENGSLSLLEKFSVFEIDVFLLLEVVLSNQRILFLVRFILHLRRSEVSVVYSNITFATYI